MRLTRSHAVTSRIILVAAVLLLSIFPSSHADELPQFTSGSISDGSIPYVARLANCTFHLIESYCRDSTDDGCSGFDPARQTDINQQCQIGVAAAIAQGALSPDGTANTLQLKSDDDDECASENDVTYNTGLHVAGVFIILFASLLGAGLPVIGKYVPFLAIHPFVLILGKCSGIGVVLAVALIHMLQPAAESLSSPCLSKAFTEDYGAYAYLFAMLAILFMQFVDFLVETFLTIKMEEQQAEADKSEAEEKNKKNKKALERQASSKDHSLIKDGNECENGCASAKVDIDQQGSNGKPCSSPTSVGDDCDQRENASYQQDDQSSNAKPVRFHVSDHENSNSQTKKRNNNSHGHNNEDHHHHHHHDNGHGHGHGHGDDDLAHGHVHSVLFMKGVKRTVSAYLLEFGVTTHSILIGMTVGVVGESELKALLVSLSFHQLFEGVALGSRIGDAELDSRFEEIIMVLIFALSAPIGMVIGIAITSSINPNGANYLYTAGIFDAICAGILLYIGLVMLIRDLSDDIKQHAPKNRYKQAAMYGSVWVGAGIMAFLGRYL